MFPPCSMTMVSPARGPCPSGYVARIVAASKVSRIVAESSPSVSVRFSGFVGFLPFSRLFAFLAFAGFVGLSDMFFSDVFILFCRSAFCWVWFDGKGSLIRQKGAVALRAFCGRWKG